MYINRSLVFFDIVTVQIHLKYLPYVIFPFSSSSTALKRCVTLICDTPMAVFRIWAKSSSVIVPFFDWYSCKTWQQDKSFQSWILTPMNSPTLMSYTKLKFGLRKSSHSQIDDEDYWVVWVEDSISSPVYTYTVKLAISRKTPCVYMPEHWNFSDSVKLSYLWNNVFCRYVTT